MAEKCLIIGLGQIGMGYDLTLDQNEAIYTHARAFSLNEDFELVGAVDPSALQRALFEQHYGKPAYPDIQSVTNAEIVSVVVIASPTVQHFSTLNEVLARWRPKAVLCEKPLAYDVIEGLKMLDACNALGVKLFVNYMRRADPGSIEVKARIDNNEIGGPFKGVVWYSKGLLNNGSHFFNLLEYWLGPFIEAKVLTAGRLWANLDPEPDIEIQFEKGKVNFIAAWEEAFSHYTIELLCPDGRLRYERGGESIEWQAVKDDPNFSGYRILDPVPQLISNDMSHYQFRVSKLLAQELAGTKSSLCSGEQALETLEALRNIINQRVS